MEHAKTLDILSANARSRSPQVARVYPLTVQDPSHPDRDTHISFDAAKSSLVFNEDYFVVSSSNPDGSTRTCVHGQGLLLMPPTRDGGRRWTTHLTLRGSWVSA